MHFRIQEQVVFIAFDDELCPMYLMTREDEEHDAYNIYEIMSDRETSNSGVFWDLGRSSESSPIQIQSQLPVTGRRISSFWATPNLDILSDSSLVRLEEFPEGYRYARWAFASFREGEGFGQNSRSSMPNEEARRAQERIPAKDPMGKHTIRHYILDERGNAVEEADLQRWAEWCFGKEGMQNRCIAWTQVGDRRLRLTVSTVFLGLDHDHLGEGFPILFETMVFDESTRRKEDGSRFDQWNEVAVRRYHTETEALHGHEAVVKEVRRTLPPRKQKLIVWIALTCCIAIGLWLFTQHHRTTFRGKQQSGDGYQWRVSIEGDAGRRDNNVQPQ